MKEPMQLEEYLRESLKFTDAAHKFFDDPTRMNYYKLRAACESHQRVTETACAFVRKVLETRDPDLDERNKSQLRSYINAKGARLGVLEEKPASEIAPTSDLHALRRLQHEPHLISKFEQRRDLEIVWLSWQAPSSSGTRSTENFTALYSGMAILCLPGRNRLRCRTRAEAILGCERRASFLNSDRRGRAAPGDAAGVRSLLSAEKTIQTFRVLRPQPAHSVR